MSKFLTLILLIAFSFNSMAEGPVVHLNKDQPSPYTGFLFTPEKEQEVRYKLLDLELYRGLYDNSLKKIDNLNAMVDLSNKQALLWQNESNKLAKEIASKDRWDTWENILYFTLGVLVTVGAGYAVNRAARK